jgi:hypothetical protein
MKPHYLIPPAVALLGSIWFLSRSQGEASSLRTEIRSMKQSLEQAKTLPPAKPAAGGKSKGPGGSAGIAEEAEKPITVEELAVLARSSQAGGMVDLRAMMSLQTRLMKLTAEDLTRLIQETRDSTLSVQDKEGVQQTLMQLLSQKDPRAAVIAMAEDAQKGGANDRNSWQFNHLFQRWAEKDLKAASAWYDAEIAAGKFENKALSDVNETRVQIESSLFSSLLKEDPAGARQRLEQLSPEERKTALNRAFSLPSTPEAQVAYADMVRQLIPEKDQPELLGRMGGSVVRNGDLKGVTEYLERIQASAEVRSATAVTAAQSKLNYGETITEENSASWRKWVQETAPEEAPKILGKVLGSSQFKDGGIDAMTALLPKVSPPGQQDQVTAAFIEAGSWQLRDKSFSLADSIQNPEIKAETLKRLDSMGIGRPAGSAPVTTKE